MEEQERRRIAAFIAYAFEQGYDEGMAGGPARLEPGLFLEYDAALAKDNTHCGDCTKVAMTCARCAMDFWEEQGQEILVQLGLGDAL